MSTSLKVATAFVMYVVLALDTVGQAREADTVVARLSREKITAGQPFAVKVHFATPLSYAAQLNLVFDFQSQPNSIDSGRSALICGGSARIHETDAELECPVPFDAPGGVYKPRPLSLGPPPGFSRWRDLRTELPNIEVIAVQDTTVYPTQLSATVSLSQKQILQSGAAKVGVLLDELNTKVDDRSAETAALKSYLAALTQQAMHQLEQSRTQYMETVKSGAKEPIFFEDLRRHYAALLVDIKAPKEASERNSVGPQLRILRVQVSTKQEVTVTPTPLSGSLGPLVSQLASLLGSHMSGFLKIAETGSDHFSLSLRSTPPGASVSYKRIGELYTDYSSPTDIGQAEFPYAIWTFRFKLGTCEVVRTPNPYIEKSPNLSVAMSNCQQRR